MQLQLTAVAYGDPRVPQRLWDKVEIQPDGCWQWTGKTDGYKATYGGCWYKGRNWRVSRLFYILLIRPVEKTEHVHHDCRNRRCVNPDHMGAIQQEDHWGHGHGDKTHCPHGHEYSPENTIVKMRPLKSGTIGPNRLCRTCINERQRKRYLRTKEN